MPEEQAFAVLVKMMSEYGMREIFKDEFQMLHLRFFQLERMIEVTQLYNINMPQYSPLSL